MVECAVSASMTAFAGTPLILLIWSGYRAPARTAARAAEIATIFQPSLAILPAWGLRLPKKQRERFAGANPFSRPGLTPWTGTTILRADAPQSSGKHSGRVERYP